MKECSYCKRLLQEEDAICTFCGYDPKTDTISPSFRPQTASAENLGRKTQLKDKKEIRAGHGIDPKVRNFAFIGFAVVVFSVFYKYNFNLNGVVSEIKHNFAKITTGKFLTGKFYKKYKTSEKIEWIDVRSFEGTKKAIRDKDLLVEGILFDPNGKSFVTINGKVVSEGETFDNITIKKINVNSVELIVDGKSKIIEVKQ